MSASKWIDGSGVCQMPTATVGRMEAADWRNLEDSKGQ
jgi:hypothetical protein